MNTNRVKDEDHYQCRKIKAERDQLRAELDNCVRAWALTTSELEKERGRVKSLAFALDQAKTSMLDSGYNPSSVVIRACNSALSAGEGGE